jgi:hypothetical protein
LDEKYLYRICGKFLCSCDFLGRHRLKPHLGMCRICDFKTQEPVFRIHDILVWIRIRIRGSMPLTNGSGSGFGIRIRILLISSLTFKTPNKNLILRKLFCLLLFEGTFTSFFKDKIQKKSENSRNQGFSYYFCLRWEDMSNY